MTQHLVEEGEHLSRIAEAYGFCRIAPIWQHPDNAALRKERTNPQVLNPGDIIAIPEIQSGTVAAATEQQHRFQLERDVLTLGLRLIGPAGKLADTVCDLQVGTRRSSVIADGDGTIVGPVAATDAQGRVTVRLAEPHVTVALDFDLVLLIGHLRPVSTREGQVARLLNLGYLLSEDDDDDDAAFQSAVEEFQCDNALSVDGRCGPKTLAKLSSVHGC